MQINIEETFLKKLEEKFGKCENSPIFVWSI
jgi:hypothetical protein